MRNHTYASPSNERMDISFFNYFSTVSLGLMCYSFFNPGFIFSASMFFVYGFTRTLVTTYDIYNTYIYTPYRKHIKKPLMHILNIDNGLYEIEIVKDGEIIHRFKTMSDFIKYNPIKFVTEDDDDSGSVSDSDTESRSETENKDSNETNETNETTETDVKIETPVDADLTNQDVTIHETDTKTESSSGNSEGDDENEEEGDEEGEEEGDEEGDEEGEEEGDEDSDEDEDDENLILEPSEYDFVLRNFYFEIDEINKPFGYCLKYETFRKSDMKKTTYTYDEIKNMVSKRRFIGIHLKTEDKDFIINLTNPVNYYLVSNTILDYSFLKMYLFNRYNFILGNTYKLSCIDNFIEMYTVEQGKKFFVKSDSFKVVDDETYKQRGECVSTPIVSNEEENDTSASTDKKDALTEADIEIVECNYNSQ